MLADPRSRVAGHELRRAVAVPARHRAKQPDGSSSPTSTRRCAPRCAARPSCSSTACCARTAASLDLLTANYTFVNERLAKHYGIPNVHGSRLPARRRSPTSSPRGGLLGQGSILTLTSYATRTSPVVRGKWVLENLLSAAAAASAAEHPGAEDRRRRARQDADDARGDDAASGEPEPARAATRGWIRSASRWRISMPSADGATTTTAAHRRVRRASPTARRSTAWRA